MTLRELAEELNVRYCDFMKFLRKSGVITSHDQIVREYLDNGFFENQVKVVEFNCGTRRNKHYISVTPKGIEFIKENMAKGFQDMIDNIGKEQENWKSILNKPWR